MPKQIAIIGGADFIEALKGLLTNTMYQYPEELLLNGHGDKAHLVHEKLQQCVRGSILLVIHPDHPRSDLTLLPFLETFSRGNKLQLIFTTPLDQNTTKVILLGRSLLAEYALTSLFKPVS